MFVWARLKMILKQDCCHYLGDQTFEEACRTLGGGLYQVDRSGHLHSGPVCLVLT